MVHYKRRLRSIRSCPPWEMVVSGLIDVWGQGKEQNKKMSHNERVADYMAL